MMLSEGFLFTSMSNVTKGYWLGLIGVVIFAMTLPVTRWVVNSDVDGSLPPGFVIMCRALIAGGCSVLYLAWNPVRFPRREWLAVMISMIGTVLGFPYFLTLGLQTAPSIQAAVVIGFLPICTAMFATFYLGHRQTRLFWFFAVLGLALVIAFSAYKGVGRLQWSDAYLLIAILFAAVGYTAGVRVSSVVSPSQAISWVLVISLPITLPATWWLWPQTPTRLEAWAGLTYLGLFSMWLGFFFWYRALLIGGTMRISQVQLLQPFIALVLSALLLGERLDWVTIVFALALIATVLGSKRAAASESGR